MAESKQKMEAISAKDTGISSAPQAESEKGDEKSKTDQPTQPIIAEIPMDWRKQLEALALKYKEEILKEKIIDRLEAFCQGIKLAEPAKRKGIGSP